MLSLARVAKEIHLVFVTREEFPETSVNDSTDGTVRATREQKLRKSLGLTRDDYIFKLS